jgi:hypothetical protein
MAAVPFSLEGTVEKSTLSYQGASFVNRVKSGITGQNNKKVFVILNKKHFSIKGVKRLKIKYLPISRLDGVTA